MKVHKFTLKNTNKVDLKTKIIYEYPIPTRLFSIAYMKVNGRNPSNKHYLLETDCDFVIFITKGNGQIQVGQDIFSVAIGDVVFVPKSNKFAVKGKMEYVTFDVPAYYNEQSKEISR